MLAIIIDLFFLLVATNAAHISHNRKAHSYLDLRIKLSPADATICENDSTCSISYTLSVLHSPNHFDLLSMMMQDGGLLKYNHNRYSDSTVLRLTKTMISHNGKVYLGIRFFDLPFGMQDYIIVDITAIIESGMKKKLEMITENYRLHVHVTKELEMINGQQLNDESMNATTCQCIPNICSCCMTFNIAKIDFIDHACANITYVKKDVGIRLSFSINGYVYISKELSLLNPPPYCLSLPFLKKYASICLRARNIKLRQTTVDGCLELDAELYHVHLATVHLGCFSIPI